MLDVGDRVRLGLDPVAVGTVAEATKRNGKPLLRIEWDCAGVEPWQWESQVVYIDHERRVQRRQAEKTVIDAAKVWYRNQIGLAYDFDVALAKAVEALLELEI